MTTPQPPNSLEAKIVVLGAQGVGKTSLVSRFINPHLPLSSAAPPSTIGASFVTKRVTDPDTATTVRLQIWDTAGQERFRSISRLYYRGAHAGLLCYDITDEKSWEEMKGWLRELKAQCDSEGEEVIIHVVGTKSDIVAEDPTRRKVPFERTIAYVAEQLYPSHASTPPLTMAGLHPSVIGVASGATGVQSPSSKRSSGFWGQDVGWDSCHEVNARDGEGIEEVFRVISRRLIEQRNRKWEREHAHTPRGGGSDGAGDDYFNGMNQSKNGSFRVGYGDKRRSWLGLPTVVGLGISDDGGHMSYETNPEEARRKGRCC
jgi:small GTP-binding protein